MLIEIRTYSLVPGGVKEYLKIYNEMGRKVQVDILGDLMAVLQPETGDLNQLVFIWSYAGSEDRKLRRERLMDDPSFTEFRKQVKHLLVAQENRLLVPA
jgi:hypothetical protein